MYRLRLAIVLGAGIGLVSGCTSLSNHPLLSRLRGSRAEECCDVTALPDSGGAPIAENCGPMILPPGGVPSAPPNGLPQVAPPPRLEPVPQSPRTPYYPSANSRGSRSLEPLGDKQN
jgi:hypothetical protein